MGTASKKPFRYFNVDIIRVVDGDTVEADVDVGFQMRFRDKFRLVGVDTPERGREGFAEATLFTLQWCEKYEGTGIEIETVKRDKYGRWLAVFRSMTDGNHLNTSLITEGHAREYHGGPRPWVRAVKDLMEDYAAVSDNV